MRNLSAVATNGSLSVQHEMSNVARVCGLSSFRYRVFAPLPIAPREVAADAAALEPEPPTAHAPVSAQLPAQLPAPPHPVRVHEPDLVVMPIDEPRQLAPATPRLATATHTPAPNTPGQADPSGYALLDEVIAEISPRQKRPKTDGTR